MGRYLAALNEGVTFAAVLETLRAGSPLAGGSFENVDNTVDMWTQADAWEGGEPAYEEALDDLAEALAAELISQAEYDEAFATVGG